jgi:hypothetical protein
MRLSAVTESRDRDYVFIESSGGGSTCTVQWDSRPNRVELRDVELKVHPWISLPTLMTHSPENCRAVTAGLGEPAACYSSCEQGWACFVMSA